MSGAIGEVIDNSAESSFRAGRLRSEGPRLLSRERGRVVLTHTAVPQALSGRWIGTRPAHGVFEMLRLRGARVAKCPFMPAFAAKHPQYLAMLDG